MNGRHWESATCDSVTSIRVGQFFYGPEQAPSSHTLSGQAAMDVGEVIRIEIEPRGDPQRVKRHRQEVQRVRRALPTL